MNVDEFRKKYPMYAHLPDERLAERLYNTYYKDKMDYPDFARRFGVIKHPLDALGPISTLTIEEPPEGKRTETIVHEEGYLPEQPYEPGAEPVKLTFDPEGEGYDYATAEKYGLQPEKGHWPSREPRTGLLLKGRGHETWDKTVKGEQDAGYEIYKGPDGRYYSRPKEEAFFPESLDIPKEKLQERREEEKAKFATDIKEARQTLQSAYSQTDGTVVSMHTGKPLSAFDYDRLDGLVRANPDAFTDSERRNLQMLRYSIKPFEDTVARAKWLSTYMAASIPGMGRLMPNLRRELLAEAQAFPGISGRLAKSSADAAWLYLKYVKILPAATGKLREGIKGVKEWPRIRAVIDTIEKRGGIKWLSEHFPRTVEATKSGLEAMTAGGVVAGAYETAALWQEGRTLKEVWPAIRNQALFYAGVSGLFDFASSVDRARYIGQLKTQLRKTADVRYKAKADALERRLAEIHRTKPPGKKLTYPRTGEELQINRSLKSLAEAKTRAYKTIDKITSDLEAEMMDISRSDTYKQNELVRESAIKSAERFAKYGPEALKVTPPGYKPLQPRKPPTIGEQVIAETRGIPVKAEVPTELPGRPPSAAEVGVRPGARIPTPPAPVTPVVPPIGIQVPKVSPEIEPKKPITPEKAGLEPEKPESKQRPKQKPGTVKEINVVGLADSLQDELEKLLEGEPEELGFPAATEPPAPIDNRKLRSWTAKALGASEGELRPEKGYSHKKAQEAMELAVVRTARAVVDKNRGDPEKIFNQLVRLYEMQPPLVSRTGKSIEQQAYSTPAPLAYLVGRLAHIDEAGLVYEPTAGTGMLLIGARPDSVFANEISPLRATLLESQGFARVTQHDATAPPSQPRVDTIVTNPPFGKAKSIERFDNYKLAKLEHIIPARAFEALEEGGRAAMVIAAPKKAGKYSGPDWVFGNYIYSHYNVIGDFEVSGDLYARQGAKWPVRVIAVHGRKKTDKVGPKKTKIRASSWPEVYNIVQEILADEPTIPTTAEREPERPERPGRGAEARPEEAEELERVRESTAQPTEPTELGREGEGRVGERVAERRPTVREPRPGGRPGRRAGVERPLRRQQVRERRAVLVQRGPQGVQRRGERPEVSEDEREREAQRAAGREPLVVVRQPKALGAIQQPYVPQSKAPPQKEQIPTYLQNHVTAALERLEAEVGDIDEFVQDALGYDNIEQMWDHLSATQVDSIALGIDRLSKGGALVVGHQTGVGKGRVLAGLTRWQLKQNKRPVFFTSGKNLYTDFYRDLIDVGLTEDEIRPVMTNTDSVIKDKNNNIIFDQHGNRQRATHAINKAISGKTDYDLLMTTYHQVNKEGNKQRGQIAALINDQILLLDESHNAAGESNTGEYIRDLLIPRAAGVLFSSATYAKTPKTMMLYARTGLLDAFDGDVDQMMAAVQAGGEPYQEVIAAALARAGAYIRTELDFTGVTYETDIDATNLARDTGRADDVTKILRQIIQFDYMFEEAVIDPKKKELKKEYKATKSIKATIGHTNFAATAHNAIKQMLLALKIDTTVEKVKQALKEGKRPIVALENTMGSLLKTYREREGLESGDVIDKYDFRQALRNMLRNVLRYRVKEPTGEETVVYIEPSQLPPHLFDDYGRLENKIDELTDLGLPGSPIDEIISRLEAEGYKVGEITGREWRLIKRGENQYELAKRTRTDRDKTDVMYGFNFGDTQVLVVNVAGAEGVSAHASRLFKNKEPRRMIVAQAAADINKFVQILGRINRTGQVANPDYKIQMTALPAEIRPAAILEKKMRSLNANTSAKTKGQYRQEDIPDILNIYGDYVVAQYVLEHPEVLREVGLSIDEVEWRKVMGGGGYYGPWTEQNFARRFTGRAALLPTEQQQEMYQAVEAAYNDLVGLLTKTGQNQLISEDKDYGAETLESKVIFVGEPGNVFQEAATLDKMSVKSEGRPLTTDEIQTEIEKVLGGKVTQQARNEYIEQTRAKAERAWETYKQTLTKKGKKVSKAAEGAWERTKNALRFGPGKMIRGTEGEPIVVLEIVDTFGKERYDVNPVSPSAIKIRCAIPHPAKTVRLSLSTIAAGQTYYGDVDRHFNVPEDAREERYIANGNIIAAMGVLTGETAKKQIRPRVINYTLKDGSRAQGLLLPKTYNPARDLPTVVNMLPEAAAAYLMDFPAGFHHLRVGEARIYKENDRQVYIEVPKSKARGQKYYGDGGLVRITGEFESWRQTMRAYFSPDKLQQALEHLKNRGNAIKSDDRDTDTAREYNNAHRDVVDPDSEEFGYPSYGHPEARKIPQMPLKREPAIAVKKPVSSREIIKYISDAFGVPMRGVATFRKKHPGWYARRPRGIRLKNVNSLRVGTHEIGHHIDIYIMNEWATRQSNRWWGIGAELVRLGKQLYGKKRPKSGYKREGLAEAVFGYLTGGIDLAKEAPNFWEAFQQYLKDNPAMAEILNTARDMIKVWEQQGADARFDAMIGPRIRTSFKEKMARVSLWMQTYLIDVSAPLQKALGEHLPERTIEFASKDPGFLFTFFTQTEGARATAFVMDNTIDLWGNKTGPGLKQVMAPVAKQANEFAKYMVAARALTLHKRGIESGFDPEDALYIFNKYHSETFHKTALAVTEWNNRVLDYLVQAGGLERKAAERMRQLNPIYIPFMRAFAKGEKRRGGGIGRGLVTRGKGIHKIIGSGRAIIDPYDSMILQCRRLISIAHKSMIARALAQMEASTEGLAGMIEKVPAPIQAHKFSIEQIRKDLERLGIDVPPGDLDDAMLTVFSNSPIYLGKEHVISVIIDGKRRFYQVEKDLYRILADLDQFQLPKLVDLLLGKLTRLVRLGATGINPQFGLLRNPMRDAADTVVKGRYARGPVALVKGIGKDLSRTGLAKSLGFEENEAAKRFYDLGGKIAGYLGQDRTSLQHLKGEMLATKVGDVAIHTVKHPVEAMREVLGVPEAGLRIEEFERALADWMKKYQPQGGEPPPDAIVYAFLLASDQTINYRRGGIAGRWLNKMTVFWNANIQDPSKVYRTFTNPKTRSRAIKYGIAFLTLPALAIWYMNKDKKWYRNLPAWEKANSIHIPIYKKGKDEPDRILRLPVPFLVGHLFQSLPVTMVDSLYEQDPKRMTDFFKEVYRANVQPLVEFPAAVAPFFQNAFNKDWAGRPIVPRGVEGKEPGDQYKQWTTRFAKAMGKALNYPPAKIDNILNSLSGGLYGRAARATELAGKKPEEIQAADWPMFGTLFVRDPYAPKAKIERFYSRLDRLSRKNQSKTLRKHERRQWAVYNRISRHLTGIRKKLARSKKISERKKLYGKMEQLIDKAERSK
jgi:predicted RNA methylase